MNIDVFSLESQDFEEMQQALSAWDHQYQQISPGAFHGSLLHTQMGSLGIFRNRWERAIRYQGTAPKGTVGLAVSLAQSGEARWMGQRVTLDDMIVQRAETEADYLSTPLWDSVVFAIPEAELAQHIADLTHDDPEEVLHTHGVIRLMPELAAQIREVSLAYLDTAQQSHDRPSGPSPLSEMIKSAVELIARAMASSQVLDCSQPTLQRRRRLVHKAKELSVQRGDQPLRIGELCRHLAVSERTLRHAFRDVAGLSPLDYLKMLRLNRVNRALRQADPAEVLVKQVAYLNGFTHLGQFCRDYKQLFDKSPSQTLQRI
ncbi:MAG: helix-turn-helix domain-containing protein [Candidatus Tectomicrobia bacterium]|nr:helix-turn-helix domain-containing protein [Candidatus Tectomicrobia bacterium]